MFKSGDIVRRITNLDKTAYLLIVESHPDELVSCKALYSSRISGFKVVESTIFRFRSSEFELITDMFRDV